MQIFHLREAGAQGHGTHRIQNIRALFRLLNDLCVLQVAHRRLRLAGGASSTAPSAASSAS